MYEKEELFLLMYKEGVIASVTTEKSITYYKPLSSASFEGYVRIINMIRCKHDGIAMRIILPLSVIKDIYDSFQVYPITTITTHVATYQDLPPVTYHVIS